MLHTHVQFLIKNLNNDIVDACGSAGVFILDGRNLLITQIIDAKSEIHRQRKIHAYVGFSIRRGTRFDNCFEVYREILNTAYQATTLERIR